MALYQECLWLAGCNCSAHFLLVPVNCSTFKVLSWAQNRDDMHLHCGLTAGDNRADPEYHGPAWEQGQTVW